MSDHQKHLRLFLQEKFEGMQKKNHRFSIRSLSKKLGISSGPLSEMLKGTRKISQSVAEKIATGLNLDASERNELLKWFPSSHLISTVEDRNEYLVETKQISLEHFELISSWIHYGILSLMRTKSFVSDLDWIAERFAVETTEVRRALNRMEKIGLIRKNDQGEWIRTIKKIITPEDIFNMALQKSHLEDMKIAAKKLSTVDVKKRDFTSFTFPANLKNIERAKDVLRRAQDELELVMLDSDAEDVYRITMYLYPLTENK